MSDSLPQDANDSSKQASACLPPGSRRCGWRSLLLALLIFASGVVVGGGATLITVRNRAWHMLQHPETAPAHIAARLRWKLGLSDEQTRQVEQIVRKRQAVLQAIRRDVQPRVVAELNKVDAEIAAVLDDRQRAEWHAMFNHLCETWLPPLPEKLAR